MKIFLGKEINLVPSIDLPTEFHGTSYGGWSVLKNSLNENSRVITVGVGEDASFDLSLIGTYGCIIHAFDPTPKSIDWVQQNISDPRFRFEPFALSNEDGKIRLFLPKNKNYVSASCRPNEHNAADYFDAPCIRLSTLLEKLGFDMIDILKMDIEGAEYAVVRDTIESKAILKVKQLLIEFHHHFSDFTVSDTLKTVSDLANVGLFIAWVSPSGHEVLFVRKNP